MTINSYPHTQRDLDNFWSRVNKAGSSCWLWTGATFDERGYGAFYLRDRTVRAHRFAWFIANASKEMPDGMVVRHSCDHPR